MKRYKTSDEVREEILSAFPEETGELFYELWANVNYLHLNWKNYRALFGTSPERIELLNWTASSFFGLLDDILRHDLVLAIARLTDPPKSAGKENASLARLVEIVTQSVDPALAHRFQSEMTDLKAFCDPVRQIRNRSLAHHDLATALQYHTDPLPGMSRAYIEEVLDKIRRLLGGIEESFRESHSSFQFVISSNDGESLIAALERARKHEKCWQRKIDKGYGFNETNK